MSYYDLNKMTENDFHMKIDDVISIICLLKTLTKVSKMLKLRSLL